MFTLLESFRSALESIRAHGFRSLLTSLGIIIGVTSVIAVVSIVQGLSYTVNAQFAGLGGNSLTVRSYTPFKQQLQGRLAKLRDKDMQTIARQVDGISHITPILFTQTGSQGAISYRSQTAFTRTFGIGPDYLEVNGVFPQEGRFFTREDDLRRRLVCAIGPDIIEILKCRITRWVNSSAWAMSGARSSGSSKNAVSCWGFHKMISYCCPTARQSASWALPETWTSRFSYWSMT